MVPIKCSDKVVYSRYVPEETALAFFDVPLAVHHYRKSREN
jgi:hypothetical protein